MSYALSTWHNPEPKRNGLLHGTSVVLIGALAGTGGQITVDQVIRHYGTGSAIPAALGPSARAQEQGVAIELRLIRELLRLSVAETAELFGVTRPTIYSWQNGNPISPENAERLQEIARALEPHLQTIESQVGRLAHRAIEGRSTLLQRLAQGADAQAAIGRLTDILGREAAQRERLSRRLQGCSGNRGAADLDSLG